MQTFTIIVNFSTMLFFWRVNTKFLSRRANFIKVLSDLDLDRAKSDRNRSVWLAYLFRSNFNRFYLTLLENLDSVISEIWLLHKPPMNKEKRSMPAIALSLLLYSTSLYYIWYTYRVLGLFPPNFSRRSFPHPIFLRSPVFSILVFPPILSFIGHFRPGISPLSLFNSRFFSTQVFSTLLFPC